MLRAWSVVKTRFSAVAGATVVIGGDGSDEHVMGAAVEALHRIAVHDLVGDIPCCG